MRSVLYAYGAGIVSRSQQIQAKMMTVVAEVCDAFGLIVSRHEAETMCFRTIEWKRSSLR